MIYTIGSIATSGPELGRALTSAWWLVALRGVAALLFGIAAIAMPAATFFALTLVFSAACLADGAFNLGLAIRAATTGGRWGLLTFHGVVALAIGLSIFISPHLTMAAFVGLVAAWAILSGLLMLELSFVLQGARGRWFLLALSIASIALGVFLLASPLLGVVVLLWWLGIDAILLGTALLALAISLARMRGSDRPMGNVVA